MPAVNFPEELKLTSEDVLNRSVILYGSSGGGKSTIINHILYILHKDVGQVLVFCPTDKSTGDYSHGAVPPPLVHSSITEEMLENLWDRQEILAANYKRANKFDILEGLFHKLNLSNVEAKIKEADARCAEKISEVEDKYLNSEKQNSQRDKIKNMLDRFKRNVFKSFIRKNAAQLLRMDLSEEEKFTVEHVNFNPRLAIVFDDCSADFKSFKSPRAKKILGKMFFQARHNETTIIMASHADTNVDVDLRQNAYMSIWVNPGIANLYFSHGANGFLHADKTKVAKWGIGGLFDDNHKLVFIRQEQTFYRYKAEIHNGFTVGARCVKNYCDRIKNSDSNSISRDNKYAEYFNRLSTN